MSIQELWNNHVSSAPSSASAPAPGTASAAGAGPVVGVELEPDPGTGSDVGVEPGPGGGPQPGPGQGLGDESPWLGLSGDKQPPATDPNPEPPAKDPDPNPKPPATDPNPEPPQRPQLDLTKIQSIDEIKDAFKPLLSYYGRQRKVSKLLDTYKQMWDLTSQWLQTKAQQQQQTIPPELEQERQQLQKRVTELEETLARVAYEQSPEFKQKYDKPIEDALAAAAADMAELEVTQPDGSTRQATLNDLVDLIGLPAARALQIAKARFGELAHIAMQHRDQLARLYRERARAIEEARQRTQAYQQELEARTKRQLEQLQAQVSDYWQKAYSSLSSLDDIRPLLNTNEADQDEAEALMRGMDLVKRAWSMNPLDPTLSPQQRQEAVQLHAAAYLRAALFGRLRKQYEKALAKIKDLETKLKKYEAPIAGGGRGQQPQGRNTSSSENASVIRRLWHEYVSGGS